MLSSLIVARRRWILVGWIVVAAVLFPLGRRLPEHIRVGSRLEVGESAAARDVLRDTFSDGGSRQAILVVVGLPGIEDTEARAALERITDALERHTWVESVLSPLDEVFRSVQSRDGGAMVLVARLAEAPAVGPLIDSLRRATAPLADTLRRRYPEARLYWTGQLALDVDLLAASARDARRAELRALPLVFVLLLWAFGAVVAAFCPIVVGVAAIGLSFGAAVLVGHFFPLATLMQNVVSLLGLALGIDYALLVVARFREQLASTTDVRTAAARTISRAGRAVVLSGATVAVGFAALTVVPVDELRSVAIGGLMVTILAVLLATTLLPALLAVVGRRIDVGRVHRWPVGRTSSRWWRRFALRVVAHPLLGLFLAGVPLVALALPMQRVTLTFPDRGWLPAGAESVRGIEALDDAGQRGLVYRLRVLYRLPDDVEGLEPAGWTALKRLHRRLATDERVASVLSLPGLAGLDTPLLVARSELPDEVTSRFLGAGGSLALFEVIPRSAVGSAELMDLVRDVRAMDLAALSGGAGGGLMVTGLPAATADYRALISDWIPIVILLVLGATFLAMMLGFRSILIPAKAVLLNLLSVGAACGALQLVFVDGLGAGLLGLAEPVEGVFPAIPLLIFCTVFGISMDYEVFLLSRIAESRRASGREALSIVQGLGRTATVITSAAAIMVVVFGAFSLGAFLPIKMLGFALAVAVLLDATLVRLVLNPALLSLAGRWNWWPGERR